MAAARSLTIALSGQWFCSSDGKSANAVRLYTDRCRVYSVGTAKVCSCGSVCFCGLCRSVCGQIYLLEMAARPTAIRPYTIDARRAYCGARNIIWLPTAVPSSRWPPHKTGRSILWSGTHAHTYIPLTHLHQSQPSHIIQPRHKHCMYPRARTALSRTKNKRRNARERAWRRK